MHKVQGTSSYRGASVAAIQHHYDLGNEFYGLWLDASLTYSCALWEAGDTLESAQLRKLDYMAKGAYATDSRHVLDVGCGWGSLLRRLVEAHGVAHSVGLTLSDAQAEWIRAWGDPRCDVRVENWSEHEPDEPYDAVISIGAFEHFARHGLPRQERVAGYRTFFERCRDWLRPGGRLALQTNAKGNNIRLDRQAVRDLRFIADVIFPESEMPRLSEIVEASETIFDVVSLRNDPSHYARTCQAWLDRLRANRVRAVELVTEEKVAHYERYLRSVVGHFENHHLNLLRLIFERV